MSVVSCLARERLAVARTTGLRLGKRRACAHKLREDRTHCKMRRSLVYDGSCLLPLTPSARTRKQKGPQQRRRKNPGASTVFPNPKEVGINQGQGELKSKSPPISPAEDQQKLGQNPGKDCAPNCQGLSTKHWNHDHTWPRCRACKRRQFHHRRHTGPMLATGSIDQQKAALAGSNNLNPATRFCQGTVRKACLPSRSPDREGQQDVI